MADDLIQAVIETADEAKSHRLELAQLTGELEEAKAQVQESAECARRRLTEHFSALKELIGDTLDRRLAVLLAEVTSQERGALGPLAGCGEMITAQTTLTDSILAEGKQILAGDVDSPESAAVMRAFKSRVTDINLNSLPEVPRLQDVPCLHVDLPRDGTDIEAQLQEAVHDYGRVLGRAPVQITAAEPRAGGVLLRWAETQSEDQDAELAEFSVRYCRGDPRRADLEPWRPDLDPATFTDAYTGHALMTLVRGLAPGQTYSFQVRGRSHGDEWSPWSVAMATTPLDSYKWASPPAGYRTDPSRTTLSTTATVDQSGEPGADQSGEPGAAQPVFAVSSGPAFVCGHSVGFRAAGAGTRHDRDALGLSVGGARPRGDGTLCVSTTGAVYVDGQEKTTRLPPLTSGSTLTFDTEVMSSSKVRVTAEIDDKILTLDWTINEPGAGAMMMEPQLPNLYFFALLHSPDWRVTVE